MNDSDPSPINLDELRLLPDWLREEGPAPSKQYASHDYPTEEKSFRGRDDRRSGGFGGPRRDARGGSGGPPDRRRSGGERSGPPSRQGNGRSFRDERGPERPRPPEPTAPAPVNVEFLPDERCLASINKQIRSTHLAYPLFGLARMFLQEPERHLVQFTLTPEAVAAGVNLYQLGEDGPITLERSTLEKIAFESSKDQFYVEETVQKEPLKGNFANVARDRQSGTLLGPTNHHGYQPALRALYDSRFSRRMSFEDFRRGIEVSTDPALVERWKEEARTTTSILTREEPPVTLSSAAEARLHFRQHHFEGMVRAGSRLSAHGSVARQLPDPGLMQAIRDAHERELRYPAQFVQSLRQGLQNAGLHIFKHRKRMVYVSLSRPTPFVAHGAVSPSLQAILATIAESPLCNRKTLAERILAQGRASHLVSADVETAGVDPVAPEPAAAAESDAMTAPLETAPAAAPPVAEDPLAKAKAALAADLRFLVQAGHIVEFHNGTFDLPLPPKPKDEPVRARADNGQKSSGAAKPVETVEAADSPDHPDDEPTAELAPTAADDTVVGDGIENPVGSTDGVSAVEAVDFDSEPVSAAVGSVEKTADTLLP